MGAATIQEWHLMARVRYLYIGLLVYRVQNEADFPNKCRAIVKIDTYSLCIKSVLSTQPYGYISENLEYFNIDMHAQIY